MGDRTFLSPYAALPAVQTLLRQPELAAQRSAYAHEALVAATRSVLREARQDIDRSAGTVTPSVETESLVTRILDRLSTHRDPTYRGLINASGILFHSSAGVTPLAPEVRTAMAGTFSPDTQTLESEVIQHLCNLTGSQDALVVSSPQAAFWLAADTLGRGREIVVSRAHLGIGPDGWSTLDVLKRCAERVVEVGTTNKTHLADFNTAVTVNTGLICSIRPTNYALKGFTEEVPLSDLVKLGTEKGLSVCADIGYALLMPATFPNWSAAPSACETLQTGANLVLLRGDGLAGGPPSGLILGDSRLVESIRRNPLSLMIKPTLPTLAAWEAQLRICRRLGPTAHPAYGWLSTTLAEVRHLTEQVARTLLKRLSTLGGVTVIDSPVFLNLSRLPSETIPSVALGYRPISGHAAELAEALYRGTPALLTRVESDQLLLHLRGFSNDDLRLVSKLLLDSC